MTQPRRASFPLRFENERTRELLRIVADRTNTSMNQLADRMIQRELEVLALGLETSLSRTVELLKAYRGDGRREAWRSFADAEALPDPVQARRVESNEDTFGVARAFEAEA